MNSIVVGDVHGCGEELEELLDFVLEADDACRIRLVGDLLTKGPEPDRVVRILDELRLAGVDIASVCGNHDLRLLLGLLRYRNGCPDPRGSRGDRDTIERLRRTDSIEAAIGLLSETVNRPRCTAGEATVVHAGIDPERGLAGTTVHDLLHRKARSDETPWWDRYDGRDGLVVFGHKPLRSPLRRLHDSQVVAVNVDTGCVAGGRLTAYRVETDSFVCVESRQIGGRDRGVVARTPSGRPRALAV
ncbi:MAG: metallophosphoesterase [Planctomycetota bacterium]|nr:metallophosphoesterase [Planctomycetota bacterium]